MDKALDQIRQPNGGLHWTKVERVREYLVKTGKLKVEDKSGKESKA